MTDATYRINLLNRAGEITDSFTIKDSCEEAWMLAFALYGLGHHEYYPDTNYGDVFDLQGNRVGDMTRVARR